MIPYTKFNAMYLKNSKNIISFEGQKLVSVKRNLNNKYKMETEIKDLL